MRTYMPAHGETLERKGKCGYVGRAEVCWYTVQARSIGGRLVC